MEKKVLIVLDILMPELDGSQTASLLKEDLAQEITGILKHAQPGQAR